MQTVTTHEFSVPAGRMALICAGRLWKPFAAIALAVIAACAVLAVVRDVAWAIVGLMAIFIAIPMAAAYLYIYHMFKPACVHSSVPHSVECDGTSATMHLHLPARCDDEGREIQAAQRRSHTYRIDPRLCTAGSKGIVLATTPPDGLIYIPYDVFHSADDANNLAKSFLSCVS